MDKSNFELNNYRQSSDTWWSMTDEYYRLLANYKRLFAEFYVIKDAKKLLSIVELEWLHIQNNFGDEKYSKYRERIAKLLSQANNIVNLKVFAGSKTEQAQLKNDLEAIVILKEVSELLYLLENDKGMLQRKQEDMMANLRKYGD